MLALRQRQITVVAKATLEFVAVNAMRAVTY